MEDDKFYINLPIWIDESKCKKKEKWWELMMKIETWSGS